MSEPSTQDLLVRFYEPEFGPRVGVLHGDIVHDVTAAIGSVADWLRNSTGRVTKAIVELQAAAVSGICHVSCQPV